MFGIGTQEILVVLALALIIIGPKRLPEVARAMGKGFGEFRRAFDELKGTMDVDYKTEREKEKLLKEYPHLATTEKKAAEEANMKKEGEEKEDASTGKEAGNSEDGPKDKEEDYSYNEEEIES